MRFPRIRLTTRRMLVAVAFVSGTVAFIGPITPMSIYGPITTDLIMLSVASPIMPDGRRGTYTKSEWAALISQMSSPAVLDAALADPRIARLPRFHGLAAPRAGLSGTFRMSVSFSEAETDSHTAINGVLLHVNSTTAVHDIADALADAIAAKGPAGVTVVGRPSGISFVSRAIGHVPWYRDWRLYTIATVSLLAALILVLPSSMMTYPSSRSAEQASCAAPSGSTGGPS
jgi:hypothetical protein